MAITPKPGYMVDPNNPNGVVPIPAGYVPPASPITAGASADNPIATASGVQDGPYTPAQVAAAAAKTSSSGTSPYSSSTMGGNAGSTSAAVKTAGDALSGKTPPPGQFTFQGGTYNTSALPVGMTQVPPKEGGYSTIATPNGPVYVAANFGTNPNQPSGGTTTPLPSGITVGTPDAKGNVPYSGNNVTANLPANGANNNTIITNANTLATDNPGSTVTANPDGSGTITTNGVTTKLGVYTFGSSSATTQATGAASSAAATNTANSAAAAQQIQTIKDQLAVTLQQLSQEMDSASTEAAVSGGLGSNAGAITDAKKRVQDAIDAATAAATDEENAVTTALGQTTAQVSSSLTSALSQIEQTAQGVANSLQQQAKTNIENTASTQNLLGLTLPNGATWLSVQNNPSSILNAQGLTRIPVIDEAIQGEAASGMTPEQVVQIFATGQQSQLKAAITNAQAGSANVLPIDPSVSDSQVMAKYGTQVGLWEAAGYSQADAISQVRTASLAAQKAVGTGQVAPNPTGVSTDPNAVVPSIDAGNTPAQIDSWLTTGTPVNVKGVAVPQQDVYNAALQIMLGTPVAQIPLLKGMGANQISELVAVKQGQIMTAYGLSPATLTAAQAEFKGMTAANSALLKTALYTKTYTATATDNLSLALTADAQVGATGAKIPNQMLQFLSGNFTPNTNLAGLDTYIYTAAREYAKVTTGVTSGAALTDTATAKADQLLNAAQSPAVFQTVVTAMQNDMANVNSEQGTSLSAFAPNVSELLGFASGGGTTDSSGGAGSGTTDTSGGTGGSDSYANPSNW